MLPADRRAAMRQIMNDANTQVESILTPDQKDKYEEMMAERRGRMRSRRMITEINKIDFIM